VSLSAAGICRLGFFSPVLETLLDFVSDRARKKRRRPVWPVKGHTRMLLARHTTEEAGQSDETAMPKGYPISQGTRDELASPQA